MFHMCLWLPVLAYFLALPFSLIGKKFFFFFKLEVLEVIIYFIENSNGK